MVEGIASELVYVLTFVVTLTLSGNIAPKKTFLFVSL